MKKFWTYPIAILLLSLAIACSGSEEKVEEANEEVSTQSDAPEMYEASELALLMRKMYDDNEAIKQQIMNGEAPESFPEDFYRIHTAQATDPDEINETFHALANQYTANLDSVVAAEPEHAIEAFNTMINTCVSCHQIYCQGPIPRIKKLHIPNPAG